MQINGNFPLKLFSRGIWMHCVCVLRDSDGGSGDDHTHANWLMMPMNQFDYFWSLLLNKTSKINRLDVYGQRQFASIWTARARVECPVSAIRMEIMLRYLSISLHTQVCKKWCQNVVFIDWNLTMLRNKAKKSANCKNNANERQNLLNSRIHIATIFDIHIWIP